MRRWRVTGYEAGHVSFWERVESSLWIRQSSISVISSQFHATRQNEQKHGKAFSEQELKNIARLILLPRSYFFCRDSCGPPYILFSKKQMIKPSVSYVWRKIIIHITIDFFLLEQLRTASKMPILPHQRHVRFWVLSPEDYKESEDAFKKVSWDKELFEDYFLNKVHRHKSALWKGKRFGHFSQVTWCPQSPSVVCWLLFLFCVS